MSHFFLRRLLRVLLSLCLVLGVVLATPAVFADDNMTLPDGSTLDTGSSTSGSSTTAPLSGKDGDWATLFGVLVAPVPVLAAYWLIVAVLLGALLWKAAESFQSAR